MKKIISTFMLLAILLLSLSACSSESLSNLKDGKYRAEFKEYDAYGWKDYIELTVVDKELSEVVFDAVQIETGNLKSADESYKNQMEPIVGTYPAKYNKDIINQFIDSGKVSAVDVVAGATQSTGNFKTLMLAIIPSVQNGKTETVIVDNLTAHK